MKNCHVLVLGASGDLGSETARFLHAQGAIVTLSGRNSEMLDCVGRDCGDAKILSCDLASAEGRAEISNACEPLDGAVFASGIAPISPVRYLSDTALSDCLAINTEAPVLLVRDLLKAKKLKKGASIVFLSSIAAMRGTSGYAAYAASKAGLEASARCLARELAAKKIRVNCVAPGMIQSRMSDGAAGDLSDEAMAAHFKLYPLGPGKGEDVASAIGFLMSGASRWITGTTLTVDGGFSA